MIVLTLLSIYIKLMKNESLKIFYRNHHRWHHRVWPLTSDLTLIFNVHKVLTLVIPVSIYKVETEVTIFPMMEEYNINAIQIYNSPKYNAMFFQCFSDLSKWKH